jgi:subtilisin family serine protease
MFFRFRFRHPGKIAILYSVSALALTACTGTGDNLGPAAERPPPGPLSAPYDPAGNPEFERNDGVDIINAESAYLRGATGAGVTVAVIDTGIDADHPDLAGNISAASFDV